MTAPLTIPESRVVAILDGLERLTAHGASDLDQAIEAASMRQQLLLLQRDLRGQAYHRRAGDSATFLPHGQTVTLGASPVAPAEILTFIKEHRHAL